MSLKTKIRIKNGKWEINGKTLAEYKGDRKVMESLLMSTFRISAIQTPVDSTHFKPEIETKVWKSINDVVATVKRPKLKAQNHRFKGIRSDYNFWKPAFMDAYPNISTMSFVRALGEE